MAGVLADRRGAASAGSRDRAVSSAALAVLITTLPAWQQQAGGKKALEKALSKGYSAIAEAL